MKLPITIAAVAGLAFGGATVAGPVAATTPALVGTVSGSVSGSLPKSGAGRVLVSAVDASTGAVVDTDAADRKGRYALSVPGGAYAVTTTVVRPDVATVTQSAAVSVKPGKTRRQVALTVKKPPKAKSKGNGKKAGELAARAFVQENGQRTDGVTAYTVESFTGAPAEYSHLDRGIGSMLATDLMLGDKCGMKQVIGGDGRKMLFKELDFQKSKYVDPATRVKRNLIIADVRVGGTISAGPRPGTVAVRVTLTDTSTGKVFDAVDATMAIDDLFTSEDALAKAVGEKLCRRPASYDITMAIDGLSEFATHRATGKVLTNVIALSGGVKPPTVWRGSGPYEWSGVSFASKTDCNYIAPIPGRGTWNATVTFVNDQQVRVEWIIGSDGAGAMTSASVSCPDGPAVPGQPGPSLQLIGQQSLLLPIGGGTGPISGGFTSGGDGWTNTGTLTLVPVWGEQAP